MSRHILTLTRNNRAKAIVGVTNAPDGYVLELREPKRTDEQNSAIHGLIAQILKQRPVHRGVRMTKEKYKAAFMHLLGSEMEFIPALEGDGFFPMGHRTSALTKGEFTNLIECVLAWCAREGVTVEHFGEPNQVIDAEYTEVKAITDGRDAAGGGASPKPAARAA